MSGHPLTEPLDVLAIGAHPDDVELFCGGTLALLAGRGLRVGMAHLTRGESGTRGTPQIRAEESRAAAEILGACFVRTLDLGDGRLADNDDQRRAIVDLIRETRPKVLIGHAEEDRHPDHSAAHDLIRFASFLANVGGYDAPGERHEVAATVYFLGHERRCMPPADWIVDISEVYEKKQRALKAYATQFNAPEADEAPATYISSGAFWTRIDVTARRLGALIGADFGEAFQFRDAPHLDHPFVRLFADSRSG